MYVERENKHGLGGTQQEVVADYFTVRTVPLFGVAEEDILKVLG
jgi:hypothetical protein